MAHSEDDADRQAANRIREVIATLHEAVVAATRRGLRVDCKLSGLGYANFDPNSSAAVTVSREREI